MSLHIIRLLMQKSSLEFVDLNVITAQFLDVFLTAPLMSLYQIKRVFHVMICAKKDAVAELNAPILQTTAI